VALLQVTSLDEAAAAAPPGSPAVAGLRRLFELLAAYGVADRVDFDASVVRGLAYYTGIVFEAFDAERKLRAVCGGGRYDRLLETLGGPAIPAVGFGFGDVVVAELLADRGLLPELPRGVDDVVCALGEAQRPAAIRLAARLRDAGRAVELVLGDARPKRVLDDAGRAGARRALFIGPDEAARGVARVRELGGGESEEPL
jgi:histidyl-tRNA synthetase